MKTNAPVMDQARRARCGGIRTLVALAAVVMLAVGGVAADTIDDLAPAGDNTAPTGATSEFTVDRPLGAGVRVQLTQWFYRGQLIATQQIWYVDLDGSGDLNRGDRVMFVR